MSNPIEVEKSWLEGLVKYVKRTEMGIQQAMKDGDTETMWVMPVPLNLSSSQGEK